MIYHNQNKICQRLKKLKNLEKLNKFFLFDLAVLFTADKRCYISHIAIAISF